MQKLRGDGSSALVTIPKRFLERDGVISDSEIPEDQNVVVDRLDERAYVVLLAEDSEFPDIEDTERVRRIAADMLINKGLMNETQLAD